MYEQIVSYFEKNLCIENIYFRRNFLLWIIGFGLMIIIELILSYILYAVIEDLMLKSICIFILDFIITSICMYYIYVKPIKEIYREKVNDEVNFDVLGLFMNEERFGWYVEIEIEEMDNFLRKTCKIKNVEALDFIIKIIDEEIQEKYEKKTFMDKYFSGTIMPILLLILTIYFTNNNEQQLADIISLTIILVGIIVIIINLLTKIKNIKIFPINKKENLLELKRVLNDIKIKWKSRIVNNKN